MLLCWGGVAVNMECFRTSEVREQGDCRLPTPEGIGATEAQCDKAHLCCLGGRTVRQEIQGA